jgi:hypothetical protein
MKRSRIQENADCLYIKSPDQLSPVGVQSQYQAETTIVSLRGIESIFSQVK